MMGKGFCKNKDCKYWKATSKNHQDCVLSVTKIELNENGKCITQEVR